MNTQRSAGDEIPTQPAGKKESNTPRKKSTQTRPLKARETQPLKKIDEPLPFDFDGLSDIPLDQISRSDAATIPPDIPAADTTLPKRVTERDLEGTRATPASYSRRLQANLPAQPPPFPTGAVTQSNAPTGELRKKRGGLFSKGNKPPTRMGCFLRTVIALLFLLVIIGVGIFSFLIYQYFRISSDLPSVSELVSRSSQFETTSIYDRNGNLLYEIMDPNAGKRTYITLDHISPYLLAATLATEDKDFYINPGFDMPAMFRALWQNYTSGEVVSGASTITQQLARILLLGPDERYQITVERKAREIILAREITRIYSKDEILEIYLNEINYGNLAYGVEAAANTYFRTTANQLTLPQAAFLAGLPQAPSVYDIFTNREVTLARSEQVLSLLYELTQERNGCVEIGSDRMPVCITLEELANAAQELNTFVFQPPSYEMGYPHWVNYIRSILEEKYGAQTIHRAGFKVYTTLDPTLQNMAQEMVSQQVLNLANQHVTDGALVAIRPATGEILAMVGSADFNNEAIAGEINMALIPRQPGSSIKPLTYTAAFEKGWTPATLIWDVPSEFPPSDDPHDTNPPYKPVNYDNKFHGPVLVRSALANSFNVPAVKTMQYVGIYDNPDTPQQEGFLAFARRMGITSLTRPYYGLSLGLGGGEIPLIEMTAAYSIFATGGQKIPLTAILKIVDFAGNTVYEFSPSAGEQVIRPEHAYLITSILSDNTARTPMFGANSVLNLPFQVAVKTGTTNDFRDNWTLGYTPDLAVGVWVGNADYTPMVNSTGLTGAAPIWSQFMQAAEMYVSNNNPTNFTRPAGIVEYSICTASGARPSLDCPKQRTELFAYDQPPLSADEDLWKEITMDTWTGLRSSSACSEFTAEVKVANVKDPSAKKWILETTDGQNWAAQMGFEDPIYFLPERECRADDPHVNIVFASPTKNQVITTSPLDIYAVVSATAKFSEYRLQYGLGSSPSSWKTLISKQKTQHTTAEKIYTWDLTGIRSGTVTLRLYMTSKDGHYAQRRVTINIQVPTMTPTTTNTPEPTASSTPTPTQTWTPTPSLTPTQTDTPTPTETPTP